MKGEKFSLMKVTNRVLDDIEEIWMDGPPSEAESVPKLYGDLMKMLGLARGLLAGLESHMAPLEGDSEDAQ